MDNSWQREVAPERDNVNGAAVAELERRLRARRGARAGRGGNLGFVGASRDDFIGGDKGRWPPRTAIAGGWPPRHLPPVAIGGRQVGVGLGRFHRWAKGPNRLGFYSFY